jgi:hypothetical protein
MGFERRGAVRRCLVGWAGAVTLLTGIVASVYAAEPGDEAVPGTEPVCGSIDPGFGGDLKGTPSEWYGGIGPGFARQPNAAEPAESSDSIDPGFSLPIERCPNGRVQDLLATPSARP